MCEVTWLRDALCRTRPADWWDFGDDGNRLALDVCSVCPVRDRCGTGEHAGVIRAGVAWSDEGVEVPLCRCGYPVPGIGWVECVRCDPPAALSPPAARAARELRMAALQASGVSYGEIALEYGMPRSTVFRILQRLRERAA